MIVWNDRSVSAHEHMFNMQLYNSPFATYRFYYLILVYAAYSTNGTRRPISVYTRAYIYFMQNLEAHDLQFKLHALLQMRYVDPRLVFRKVAPKRREPIVGESALRDIVWTPHIFLANERASSVLGTAEKDVLTSVSPDGTVIVSTRIQATLHCWMNLQKFPFDEQKCSTVLESCE